MLDFQSIQRMRGNRVLQTCKQDKEPCYAFRQTTLRRQPRPRLLSREAPSDSVGRSGIISRDHSNAHIVKVKLNFVNSNKTTLALGRNTT